MIHLQKPVYTFTQYTLNISQSHRKPTTILPPPFTPSTPPLISPVRKPHNKAHATNIRPRVPARNGRVLLHRKILGRFLELALDSRVLDLVQRHWSKYLACRSGGCALASSRTRRSWVFGGVSPFCTSWAFPGRTRRGSSCRLVRRTYGLHELQEVVVLHYGAEVLRFLVESGWGYGGYRVRWWCILFVYKGVVIGGWKSMYMYMYMCKY